MHTSSRIRARRFGAVPFALLAIACGSSTVATEDAAVGTEIDAVVPMGDDAAIATGSDAAAPVVDAGAPPLTDVTYYEHVRPILADRCVNCHSEGSIAPFALQTYEQVLPWAHRLMEVTRDRIMPPYLANASGDCQNFRDSSWLSDREIETFQRFDDQGAPEGDPNTPAPTTAPLATLDGTTIRVNTGVDYAPVAGRTDDYRCFVVDLPRGGYVTGYNVHPGNRQTVHHVIGYAPLSDSAAAEARQLDTDEAGPGYTCFGGASVDAMPVVLWAPGGGATNFPRGTGVQIDADRPFVIQVHYNTLGGGGTDRTEIELEVATSAVPAYLVPIVDNSFRLPPRMPTVTSSDTQSLNGLGMLSPRIFGAFPHMHTLGRNLQVTAQRGSENMCLLDVPRWDFNWQQAYWYESPIRVSSSDEITISCTWSTMEREEVVTWGEGTQDEMCLSFFYVSI